MIDFGALAAAEGLPPTATNISRLAEQYGAETASWAFHQWSLRERAKQKFCDARDMLFTQAGLEQASHERVASYHASRFPEAATVADLTCGIGADLIALAKRGPAVGFEIDPITAEYASHNLRKLECEVVNADCLAADWNFEYAFADPSRRSEGTRTLDPSAFQPDPAVLSKRLRNLSFAGMKMSPMLSDEFLASLSPSIEFISYGWECREAMAWYGAGAPAGTFALKVETGERLVSGGAAPTTEVPTEYFYEADPAAIRAHCLPAVCETVNAAKLGDSNGYLSGPELRQTAWARSYRVLEAGSFDIKRVRQLLKTRGGGTPEVKSRAKLDTADLRRRLATPGRARPVLAVYAVKKSIRFALLEPITST